MITKKLNNHTFGWNEAAFEGKGYWYVMGKNGSFARAASRLEASTLGKPDKKETAPVSPKVYKEKSIEYAKAQELKKKSLKDLIADKILSGESVGKSIKSSIGEKLKARSTRTKQFFDPLNMISAMTGRSRLGTAIAARMLGRSSSDARYFLNEKAPKEKGAPKHTKLVPEHTEPKAKRVSRSTFNDKALLKIEHLLETKFQYDKKQREIRNSFKVIDKKQDEVRHEKLLNAILSLSRVHTTQNKSDKKSNGIFGILIALLSGYEFIKSFLKNKLKDIFKKTFSWIGEKFLKWGKGLFDFITDKIGWIGSKFKKIATKIWDSVSDVATKLWKGIREGMSKIFDILEKIPGVKKLVGEIIPKGLKSLRKMADPIVNAAKDFGGKAVKVSIKGASSLGETATKVGSKALRGAEAMGEFFEKLKPIAKAIPGVDGILAIGLIADNIYDAIKQYKAGKINGMGLEKAVIQAITGVLGGVGGAEIGAFLGGVAGSFIPVIGNLIGTLVGGAAGWMGGEFLGKKLGKGMFDFFVNSGDKISVDISKAQKYIEELKSKFTATKVGSKSPSLMQKPPTVNKNNTHNIFSSNSQPPTSPARQKTTQMPKMSTSTTNVVPKINENNKLKTNSKSNVVKPVNINKNVSVNTETNDDKTTLSGGASVRDKSTDSLAAKNYDRAFGI